MILLLAFCFVIIGTFNLKQQGSLTNKFKSKAISVVCNVISVILFINYYGTARGIFIYLAAIALLGMIITLINTRHISTSHKD
ncbi:MAG: hypothetical protein OCD00_05955 [Colwellia sp.]